MHTLLAALLGLTLLLPPAPRPAAADKGSGGDTPPGVCLVGANAPSYNPWRWPAGTSVRVYYRRGDFSPAERSALDLAVAGWQTTLKELRSDISIAAVGEADAVDAKPGDLTVIRYGTYRPKERNLAVFRPLLSLESEQLLNSGLICIDPKVRKPEMLTGVMSHELGHGFGMSDCKFCRYATTIMRYFESIGEGNGLTRPSDCDRQLVSKIYPARRPALAER